MSEKEDEMSPIPMEREKHESFLSEIRSHVNAERVDELWAGMDLEGLKRGNRCDYVGKSSV